MNVVYIFKFGRFSSDSNDGCFNKVLLTDGQISDIYFNKKSAPAISLNICLNSVRSGPCSTNWTIIVYTLGASWRPFI